MWVLLSGTHALAQGGAGSKGGVVIACFSGNVDPRTYLERPNSAAGIPTDRDICPGSVPECPFVKSAEECALSGGSTFSVAFRASRVSIREKRKKA